MSDDDFIDDDGSALISAAITRSYRDDDDDDEYSWDDADGPMHMCPPDGAVTMPCCGRTPFEVPRSDRMTIYSEDVTCKGRSDVDKR